MIDLRLGDCVNWVKQEDSNGCGIACLAMIVGKTYAEVRAEMSQYFDNSEGLSLHIVDEYLADHGYAVARKFESSHWCQTKYGRTPRDQWPCAPFANVHLVQVESCIEPYRNHFVIMLRDGNQLDPLHPYVASRITYPKGWNIAGITRIAEVQA